MKFNSAICTSREKSERLLALGLKKETADMVILEHPRKEGRYFYIAKEDANWDGFPAWSLHRLIEMMPDRITLKDENIDEDYSGAILEFHHKAVLYESSMVKVYRFNKKTNNLYDNLIDCIEWLIKEGYFNKEYLEEIL